MSRGTAAAVKALPLIRYLAYTGVSQCELHLLVWHPTGISCSCSAAADLWWLRLPLIAGLARRKELAFVGVGSNISLAPSFSIIESRVRAQAKPSQRPGSIRVHLRHTKNWRAARCHHEKMMMRRRRRPICVSRGASEEI